MPELNGLSNKYCFISYIYLHMFKTLYITMLVHLAVTVTFGNCQLQLLLSILILLFLFPEVKHFFPLFRPTTRPQLICSY